MALDATTVRHLLDYDPLTGVFLWRNPPARRHKKGDAAGCRHIHNGYIYIKVLGKSYFAHRLAWLHVHGEWPSDQVDHIDRDRTNNRISNLRLVTGIENSRNRTPQKGCASVYTGVSFHKRMKRWQANIRSLGVLHHLGYFDREETARDAYLAAKAKHHPISTYSCHQDLETRHG